MKNESDLYFMFNSYTGLVKIGIANDVQSRRHGLEVLAVFPDDARYERPLHEAFTAERQIGEWFVPTLDILGLIERTETISALLARYEPKIAEYRQAAIARAEERSARQGEEREREKQRLAAVKAEEARIKREEAAKRAKAKAKRDAKDAEEREAMRVKMEETRRLFHARVTDEISTESVFRKLPHDRHNELVSARTKLVRSSQRARNAAVNGVRVTTDG